jgi:hypothetical protein
VLVGAATELAAQRGEPLDPQTEVDGVALQVNTFDQKFDDAVCRKELVPQWLELKKGIADIALRKTFVGLSRSSPGLDDDLGGLEQ